MSYRPNRKPESLHDVHIRFGETVRYSDESVAAWALMLGTRHTRLTAIIDGRHHGKGQGPARLSALELLEIDGLTGLSFLTPPERDWARAAVRRNEYQAGRRLPRASRI